MKTLIKNGTVVFFDRIEQTDILIDGSVISGFGKFSEEGCNVIDAKGLHVFAGFTDMHVHLREPGHEHKETVLTGGQAAVKGGFTSIACMPNTSPVNDNAIVLDYILNKAKQANSAKVYPICAITKDEKGEQLTDMLTLYRKGAVAFSDDGVPVKNAQMLRNALEYTKAHNIPVLCHCEDESLMNGGSANEGKNATVMGLAGIPRMSEAVGIAREICVAEGLKAAIHICHVSTREGVQLIREAKARGVKVTAETCPHYFTLTDDMILGFNTNAKINPPLREKEDVEAIINGLKDGTLDCLVTDHAPHSAADKNCEFASAAFGASGFETAFAVFYTELVKKGHISLPELSVLMTKRPAEILKINAKGLAEGAPADITVADLSKSWMVDAKKFVSKGKNTPFDGMKFSGRVEMTFVDGVTVFGGEK